MNENDLSFEKLLNEARKSPEYWKEAYELERDYIKNLKANPWQLFSTATLRELRSAPTTADNIYAIDAELERRKAK